MAKRIDLGNPMLVAAAMPMIQDRMRQQEETRRYRTQMRSEATGLARFSPGQIIAYSLLGGGIVIGGVWFISKKIGDAKQDRSVDKADDFDTPASFALRFRQAMDGLGTDEATITDLARQIPTQEFLDKVKDEYRKQTHGTLLLDALRSDLTSWEFRETLAILATKPKNKRELDNQVPGESLEEITDYARAIFLASDGTGTDEEEIYRICREIPTIAAWKKVNKVYKDLYGYDLLEEFLDELWESELQVVYGIAKEKPDYNTAYGISKNIR